MDQATIFDVDVDEPADESGGGGGRAPPFAARRRETSGAHPDAHQASSTQMNLAEYLASLPILSVGHKHTAAFECDTSSLVNASAPLTEAKFQLVWIKLVPRGAGGGLVGASSQENDITPLSLNKRIITPDRRFRVQLRAPHKWLLTIENVGASDDKAFYLCQSGGSHGGASNFIGGARLSVLTPPKLIETETSPSLVSANEFEPFKLVCKVTGEPQAQIAWRREDGRPLDGLEQRFRHQLDRSQAQRLLSIDSSELLFEPMRREQAGAYLCIATNGVQPGVSQRMSVAVVKCRENERPDSRPVDCGQPVATSDETSEAAAPDGTTSPLAQDVARLATADNSAPDARPDTTTTLASTSTTTQPPPPSRTKWKLSTLSSASRLNAANHSSSAQTPNKRPGQQQQQRFQIGDKTRNARPAPGSSHKNDRALANNANNRRLLASGGAAEASNSANPSSGAPRVAMQITLATACAMALQIAAQLRPAGGRSGISTARMLHEHH